MHPPPFQRSTCGRLHGLLLVVGLLACGVASCGDSGNFERTVGPDLAHMHRHPEAERPVEVRIETRLPCDEFCRASQAKRVLEVASDTLRSERLDHQLRAGYRRLGENLAARLWDDPAGRRIRFDIDGRPGLGLEIPFD